MAYYLVEPWGERMADIRAGMICSTLANINRDSKRTPDPFQPADFMPWVEKKQEPVLNSDPADQAQLVALTLFGIDLNKIKSEGKRVTIKRRKNG